MAKIDTKKLKKDYYFMIYDQDDNIIAYLENADELIAFIKCAQLFCITQKLNISVEKFINVIVDGKKYKLYTYKI